MNSQELILFIVCLFKSQLQSDFYSKNKYIHLFIIQRTNIFICSLFKEQIYIKPLLHGGIVLGIGNKQ